MLYREHQSADLKFFCFVNYVFFSCEVQVKNKNKVRWKKYVHTFHSVLKYLPTPTVVIYTVVLFLQENYNNNYQTTNYVYLSSAFRFIIVCHLSRVFRIEYEKILDRDVGRIGLRTNES